MSGGRELMTGAPPAGSAVSARACFDPELGWELASQVSLRAESFGALAYHFGTRRLSFLKSPTLLRVVELLGSAPTAREACRRADVAPGEMDHHLAALATLAGTGMIVARSGNSAIGGREPTGRTTGEAPR
jgi:putative mycofactocin binding protein MftB